MRIVFLGLSITSSWGNGHATNYRGLLAALRRRGHHVLFLERDKPWYAAHRDFAPPWVHLYGDVAELHRRRDDVRVADLVVVGSYVPDGCEVARWVLDTAEGVTAFWDIDTPVTSAKLAGGDHEYLSPELLPRFDLYLSFTGGPLLAELGARRPTPFYCVADHSAYRPLRVPVRWELGYLGTYSDDRQPKVEALLLEPARQRPDLAFALAGPQYPQDVSWPPNVEHFDSLPPAEHPGFYCAQRFTLNVTRAEMVRAGWSPSVRLFEAAACGVPVISDWWEGLDAFFEPEREILVAEDADDVLRHLARPARDVGARARERVLREHTADHRARELEAHVAAVREQVPA
ncbi:MAG TPA: glycosyltransferase [Gaiellaceae bacterium]|nr:glycosyltransferase [Gaiellaceae bacterium]